MSAHLPFESSASSGASGAGEDESPLIDQLWQFFISERGAPLLPSCREIELLIGFVSRGIPRHLIQKGIVQIISQERELNATKHISLIRCEHEINRLFRQSIIREVYQNLKEHTSPENESTGFQREHYLTLLSQLLDGKLKDFIENSSERSKRTRKYLAWVSKQLTKYDYPDEAMFEEILDKLDQKLTTEIISLMDETDRETLLTECRIILKKYKKSIPSNRFEGLCQNLLRERMRVRYGLRPLIIDFQALKKAVSPALTKGRER